MNTISLIILTVALSADTLAVAIGQGASLNSRYLFQAFRMGLVFGLIGIISIFIGWLFSKATLVYIEHWGSWIAFFLIAIIGLKMIYESINARAVVVNPVAQSLVKVSLIAIGANIDSISVGMGLALKNIDFWLVAVLLGLVTTLIVIMGALLGKALGTLVGRGAEFIGGLTLIGVGVWILIG